MVLHWQRCGRVGRCRKAFLCTQRPCARRPRRSDGQGQDPAATQSRPACNGLRAAASRPGRRCALRRTVRTALVCPNALRVRSGRASFTSAAPGGAPRLVPTPAFAPTTDREARQRSAHLSASPRPCLMLPVSPLVDGVVCLRRTGPRRYPYPYPCIPRRVTSVDKDQPTQKKIPALKEGIPPHALNQWYDTDRHNIFSPAAFRQWELKTWQPYTMSPRRQTFP